MAQQDDIQWLEEDTDPSDIQWLEADTTAADPPPQEFEEPARDTSPLADISSEIAAGAVSATGYALEGLGEASRRAAAPIAAGLNWAFDTNFFRSANVLSGASTATDKFSKEIEAEQSAEWRKAKAGTQITGDLTDPSTWSWGADPSLKGFAAQTLNVLGQAGPMAALAVATRGQGLIPQLTATGTVGASTTVGAGRSEIRSEVESMTPQQLQSESALYRDRVAQGDTPDDARQKVIDTVSDDSFWKLAGIGGLGGFATGYVLGGAAKKLGANAIARAGMEGLGEGSEELLEGIAKNDAFGAADIKKDLMEGSFGNLAMGALGGASVSTTMTVGGREIDRVRDLTSRTNSRRAEAAAAGEDSLTQELAAATGMAEEIQSDTQRVGVDTSEQDVSLIQARNDLIERVAGGAVPSIPEAAPVEAQPEAPLPPAVEPAPVELPAAGPTPTPPAIEPTQVEPAPVEVAAAEVPDIVTASEAPAEAMAEADLFAMRDEAITHNKSVDSEFVAANFDEVKAAEFEQIKGTRKKNRWLDDNLTADQDAEIQNLYANDERIEEFASKVGQFDITSPADMGASIGLWFKDVDSPGFKETPEYAGIASALRHAKQEGWNLDDVIAGARTRATKWAGADAAELFPRFFEAGKPAAGVPTKQPALEAKKAERADAMLEVPIPAAPATDVAKAEVAAQEAAAKTVEREQEADKAVAELEAPLLPTESAPDFESQLSSTQSVSDSVDWIAERSTNDSYKEIASKIKDAIPVDVKYTVYAEGDTSAPSGLDIGSGLYQESFDEVTREVVSRVVSLRGGDARTAAEKEQDFLHEAIHAALNERLREGQLPAAKEQTPELAAAVVEMQELADYVVGELDARKTKGTQTPQEAEMARTFADVSEFPTWGLASPVAQDILKTIPRKGDTTWSAFVRTVARVLGISQDNVNTLSELIDVTGKVAAAPFKKPVMEAKKAERAEPAPETSAMAIKRAAQLKRDEVDAAAAEAQASPENGLAEPTEAQIEAANYKKGHVKVHGLDMAIESPRGSVRKGTDPQGKEWETTLKDHYGYIKRSEGADGDQVDVFIAPDVESDSIFVVDQVDPKTGKFDEHKVIMGAKTVKQARAIYKRNYARGWKGERTTTEMTVPEFKTWLKEGDTTKAIKPMETDKVPPAPPVEAPPTPPAPSAAGPAFKSPDEGWTDYIRRRMQDKMHPLRQTQEEIAKARGGEALPDELDALEAEESFYGKAEEQLRKLKDNLVRPMTEVMATRNVSQEELDLYLMAKHAEERNDAIAEINPDMPDGGSGMMTMQADAILERTESEGRTADFEAVSQYVYDILQAQRDTLKEGGLEVSDLVDVYEAKYENYVPLKGHAKGEPDAKGNVRRAGGGFDIRGKESLRALGRRSLAESPLINAIIDTTAAITRAEKNKVGNTFLKLVEDNPNPDYWEVFTASESDVKRGIKLVDGAETVSVVKVGNMGKDRYFATKLNGVEYKVKINDDRLLRAMNNLGPEPLGPVLKHLGSVTRFLSSMHTTYNPEFVISNVARDVQTAVLNVLAEQDIPGGRIKHEKIAGKMVKGIPVAVRAINASLHGKPLTGKAAAWQKVYEQFREAGAQTGWFDQKDFEGQAKELQSMLTEAQGGVKGNAKKFGRTVADVVHNFNTAIENGVRLSAFKAAIEAGVSEQKAASMAKNLTVNFNRKGEVGNVLNTAYMFANASIQGTATFLRAMGTLSKDIDTGKRKLNPAQKVAAGMAAVSFGLATLNRSMAGDDDDGVNWYDKVPQYVRERNIVIMKSIFGGEEGEYYTFPLPYAYNIFHVFGDQAESVVSGAKEPGAAALNVTASLLGSFSPIGINLSKDPEKGILRTLTPTVLSPVAQLAINENFFGSAIYRENMAFGAQYPDSALGKPNTAGHWKAVSKWLNEATGGKEFIPGSIDVNPDTLKFLAEFVGGGAGAFAVRTGDLTQKMFTGQEVEPHEIPFKRKLVGKVRPFEDLNKFYERRVEIGQHELQADSYQSKMEQRKYRRENEGILGLKGLAKRTSKKLSHQRKRRLKIMGNDKLTKVERDKQIKQIDRETKGAIDKFNKAYNEATKK